MNIKKIVITGAPGTGKTLLVKALENQGYHCFPEIIRDMTFAAKQGEETKTHTTNPLTFVDDPFRFNKKLLEGRREHFRASLNLNASICFFDRGIPDVLAYMDYFGQTYPSEFVKACREHKYDQIFILPPWKEIYVSDNERMESFEQAEELHTVLKATYERFKYPIHILPKTTVQERVALLLDMIN